MTTYEVAPGIYRIESILGPRPFAQYLLRDERSLLVDTGIATTPDEVILPAFQEVGLDPADLDYVLISHADVDHFGGNAAIRAAARGPSSAPTSRTVTGSVTGSGSCASATAGYAAHGSNADYDADTKDGCATRWVRTCRSISILCGGEVFRLGPHLSVEVLHLPGHSAGHIGLWDPATRSAIITDAVVGPRLMTRSSSTT